MPRKKSNGGASSLSSEEKAAIIRKRAEKACRQLNAAGVPAFVNFDQEKPETAPTDEFGFTSDDAYSPSADEEDSTDEE